MMHLFTNDVLKAMDNIISSGSEYLLMTTHSNNLNEDLPGGAGGRWRPINFFKSPFYLPSPICLAKDTHEDLLYIMLYDIKSLKRSLG